MDPTREDDDFDEVAYGGQSPLIGKHQNFKAFELRGGNFIALALIL